MEIIEELLINCISIKIEVYFDKFHFCKKQMSRTKTWRFKFKNITKIDCSKD